MNMHHADQTVEPERVWQSAWLLVSGALKSPDQAPSPTCPFIKNQQCQRTTRQQQRTAIGSPIYTGGAGYPLVLATNSAGGRNRQRRVGEAHLGGTRDSVKRFFKFLSFSDLFPDFKR